MLTQFLTSHLMCSAKREMGIQFWNVGIENCEEIIEIWELRIENYEPVLLYFVHTNKET